MLIGEVRYAFESDSFSYQLVCSVRARWFRITWVRRGIMPITINFMVTVLSQALVVQARVSPSHDKNQDRRRTV